MSHFSEYIMGLNDKHFKRLKEFVGRK